MITKQARGTALAAVDDSHLPVVITTFRGHIELDMAQWHHTATFRVLSERHRLGHPTIYITDARGMHVPSAVVRKYWADIMKEHESMLNALLGNWVVMDGPVMRGALTAIEWFTPLERRIQYVANLQQALSRANASLVKGGYSSVTLNAENYHVD